MIYSYDRAAQIPLVDIYDTQMMLAQVNAAKDMYDKALEEMKAFSKEYSEFFSPFANDMAYYQNIVNGVQSSIDDMYARGIDPLRSMEGRTEMLRRIRGINPATMAAMKANAKMGAAYLSALGELQAKNQYDQTAENMRLEELGIKPFEQFSSINPDGTVNSWTQTSPIQFQTLHDLTDEWYKNRQAHIGNKEDVESFLDANGNPYKYDPRYEYQVFTDKDLLNIARNKTPGWEGSFWSRYYRKIAEDKLKASGQPYTSADIETQLQRDIADAQQGYLIAPQRDADKFALEEVEQRNRIALENLKYSHDVDVANIKAGGGDGNKRQYSYRDNITESGLKNSVGWDPNTFLGYDAYGDEITMMQYSNNNPKFFKDYKDRLNKIVGFGSGTMQIAGIERTYGFGTRVNDPNRITDRAVDAMTHTKNLKINELANFKDQTEIKEYGDNDVTGLGLVYLNQGDASKLYTKSELGYDIIASANGKRTKGNRKYDLTDEDGKLDPTIVAHTDTSTERGLVTAFVNGHISNLMPIVVYKDKHIQPYAYLYLDMGYNGVQNSGDVTEWDKDGISTIYDGQYEISGQSTSVTMDKSRSVGNSQVVSSSIGGTP